LPQVETEECCALRKAEPAAHECEKDAPKSAADEQCCAACSFCLLGVIAAVTPFVYPPMGDETFAAYISSGHFLPDRPPVPPPRA
jgi:hypothetical protein